MTDLDQKWPDHLVIIRHGESDRNVRRQEAEAGGVHEYGGGVRDPDVELSNRGRAQALETGRFLHGRQVFDIVHTSPYRRARQTTELLLKGFSQRPDVIVEERVREKEFGILDGLVPRGIEARFPEEAARKKLAGKYYYRPPGGENYPDVNLRIHSFLGTLTRDWRRKSVLVVCHSVIVLAFRRLFERLTEDELLAIDSDPEQEVRNCSVTWHAFDPGAGSAGKLVLKEFNGVHYSSELSSAEPSRTKSLP